MGQLFEVASRAAIVQRVCFSRIAQVESFFVRVNHLSEFLNFEFVRLTRTIVPMSARPLLSSRSTIGFCLFSGIPFCCHSRVTCSVSGFVCGFLKLGFDRSCGLRNANVVRGS